MRESAHTKLLLPVLSELMSSQNNENVIPLVAVPQLSQTPLTELILPPELVSLTSSSHQQTFSYNRHPLLLDPTPKLSTKEIKPKPFFFRTIQLSCK